MKELLEEMKIANQNAKNANQVMTTLLEEIRENTKVLKKISRRMKDAYKQDF